MRIATEAVDDGLVLAGEPFPCVAHLADVDLVFEEIGQRTVGELNPAVVFLDFGIPSFGDDAFGVEVIDQLLDAFQVEIAVPIGNSN